VLLADFWAAGRASNPLDFARWVLPIKARGRYALKAVGAALKAVSAALEAVSAALEAVSAALEAVSAALEAVSGNLRNLRNLIIMLA
jgi:methyl-accepting chemotaxis protein